METTTDLKPRIDVYSLVTDKITAQLETGVVPWQKLWNRHPPTNLITKEPYIGINALLLGMEQFESNYFLTFDEVNSVGGRVKKDSNGAQGHQVGKESQGRKRTRRKRHLLSEVLHRL